MKYYEVERMTEVDYGRYMGGGYNYHVEHLAVKAENAEEAREKVKADGYVVNGYVKEVGKKRANYLREQAEKRKEKARQKLEQYQKELAMLEKLF